MKTAKRLCAALLALALVFTPCGLQCTNDGADADTHAGAERNARARCGAGCARHVRSL